MQLYSNENGYTSTLSCHIGNVNLFHFQIPYHHERFLRELVAENNLHVNPSYINRYHRRISWSLVCACNIMYFLYKKTPVSAGSK